MRGIPAADVVPVMLKMAVKRTPVVGAVVRGAPGAVVAPRCIVPAVSGEEQTVPTMTAPLRHSRTVVAGPAAEFNTVSVRSIPAGFKNVRSASSVMSKALKLSESPMNTPIRTCCPTGPEKTAGLLGQGFDKNIAEESTRHTVPVRA